jgi:nucleoid-associated protein Lsr2
VARRVEVQLIDDIDGDSAAETVAFGLDGRSYEIDLNAKHAAELRALLGEFIAAGRRLGRERAGGARGATAAPRGNLATAAPRGSSATAAPRGNRALNRAIREWAGRRKIELSERGRIPRSVIEEYEAQVEP